MATARAVTRDSNQPTSQEADSATTSGAAASSTAATGTGEASVGTDGTAAAPVVPTTPRRVVCTRQNASTSLNGVAFATAKLGETKVHISEHIADDSAYKRFLSIKGFEAWEGDEGADGRTIEDALAAARAQAPGESRSALADYERQLEEYRRANRSMAESLRAKQSLIDQLTKELAETRVENEMLKAAGARIAAPAPSPSTLV